MTNVEKLLEYGAKIRHTVFLATAPDVAEDISKIIYKYEKVLKIALDALHNQGSRLFFLKQHSSCIGIMLRHVDGNCVHCFSKLAESKTIEALKEINEIAGKGL